jgi:dUTPase
VVAIPEVKPTWAEKLTDTSRGRGGFGSTGTT